MGNFICYILLGGATGFLSGLFGIGGGIIVVPALIVLLEQHSALHLNNIIHIAVSTSLIVMMITSASSAYAYRRRHALIWSVFWKMQPGLCLGLISGTLLTATLSSRILLNLLILFLICMAIYLSWDAKRSLPSLLKPRNILHHFSIQQNILLIGGSFLVGSLSTLFGIGGGILMVPLFLFLHCSMQEAAGTSTLCSIISALIGTILLAQVTQASSQYPYLIHGIYWPAALSIAPTAILCAPLGTRLAFYLNTSALKRIFAVVLLISAWGLFKT